jgi:Glutaredoxin, GrxC family|tara:strand:- start:62 stop:322 length:261 start_codon:yes stop_codon:yes gene_type:complete
MKKVVIYTGPMCNFCSAAKHLLNKKKVSYEEINIGYDEKKRDEMLKKSNGAKTIPQIFVEEKHIGGYVELKALEAKGELDSLLGIS